MTGHAAARIAAPKRVRRRRWPVFALLALGLAGCEFPDEPPARAEDTPSAIAPTLQAANAEAAALYRVVETYFNEYLALNPVFATALGDHRFDDRFGDYASPSWMADSLGIEQEALERLATVDPRQLRGEDRVSYDAFRRQCELSVQGYRYPSELLAIDAVDNWPLAFAQLASGRGVHPFRTTRDYDHFLARMDGFVAWTEQAINNLRAGVAKGVVLPKAVVQRTLPQLEPFTRIEDPRASVFWQPLLNFPAGLSVADRKRLLEAYDRKLREQVLPAYRRLYAYLAQEYLPQARDTIAWSDLPSGDLWYAWLVRYHTTTRLTPDQVHELGLHDVARLRANLAGLQPALGIAGDLRAVLDAMRTAPVTGTAAERLSRYDAVRRSVEAGLPAVSARGPAVPIVLRAVGPERAAFASAVSGEPGNLDGSRAAVLWVVVDGPAAAPTYDAAAAYLREAVPGRIFQASIARRTAGLPSFRRFGTTPAYVDGWAAYAATLGGQLGLYGDAASQFGALAAELADAAALVVDTGIHARGWNRQRAVDYLRANTALDDAGIDAALDRIVARPGTALAAKVGQLRIVELRRHAQQRLGARFDLREFHDVVLGGGPLPLDVLATRVERWAAGRR